MAKLSIAVKVSFALLAIAALVAMHLSISKVNKIMFLGLIYRYLDGLSIAIAPRENARTSPIQVSLEG
jgi:hypothetical protein